MPQHTARKRARKRTVSRAKAKKILSDGSVRGQALTKPQRGFFGARAGGKDVGSSHRPRRR